jgi:hypothetical protein
MDQSRHWETKSHLGNQEILRLLLNLRVHYRVNNSPSLVPEADEYKPHLPTLFP